MNVEYGTATVEDLPRIVEMKVAMFEKASHHHLLADEAESLILKDYQHLYRENTAVHFVARDGGQIVASVGAFIKSDLPFRYFSQPTYGFVGDVYTEAEYRGAGIATTLTKEALSWFKSKGVVMVRLLASDAGRPIYERMGFTTTDEMELVFKT